MPQTIQHTAPASNYAVLVTFTWGTNSVARYVRWTDNVTIDTESFLAVPTLSAKPKKAMEGGTSAEEVEITMPIDLAPMVTAVMPYKHPEIKVKIEEFAPGTGTSRRTLFFGRVGKIKVSPSGAATLARVQVKGIKARLAEARIGMQALSTCLHTFGDNLCGFDLEANKEIFTPTVFNVGAPNRIQGNVAGGTIDATNSRWARGFLKWDNTPITIRAVVSYSHPALVLDLREIPPTSWNGQPVEMFPGCDKTIDSCRDSFRDRESSFLAPGIAMLPYNPGFSDAPDA